MCWRTPFKRLPPYASLTAWRNFSPTRGELVIHAGLRSVPALSAGSRSSLVDAACNNIVEQDHRRVKQRLRPMFGLKSFRTAARVINGIESARSLRRSVSDRNARRTRGDDAGDLASRFGRVVRSKLSRRTQWSVPPASQSLHQNDPKRHQAELSSSKGDNAYCNGGTGFRGRNSASRNNQSPRRYKTRRRVDER